MERTHRPTSELTNVNMKGFVLLVLGIGLLHTASAVTHSLKYFYTGSSEVNNFPEFMVEGMVDDVQMVHYDSNSQRAVPKQDWMNKRTDTQYWERETGIFLNSQQVFKAGVDILKQRFNQSGGVHVLQQICGCELDDDGITQGYFQFGYDGADFLSLDKSTRTWTAANQKAVITKLKWDATGDDANIYKNYLENTWIEWIKTYVNYGKDTLERKVPPSVSLLQKTPSSPVTCHATGFYPSGVTVVWQIDGQEQHEDVLHEEILPNEDGTFQKSAHLTMDSEEWENNNYTCVVEHKENIIAIRLDQSEIKTNSDKPPESDPIIIGVVVAVILRALITIAGFIMWNRKRTASDDGSDPSMTQQNQIQLEVSLSLIKQERSRERGGPLLKDSAAS
uniref:Ig-like domain-containing protein n=1 Tax=Hucho hucho TaxID=62062 RepID=A0A4W5R3R0_9TELE